MTTYKVVFRIFSKRRIDDFRHWPDLVETNPIVTVHGDDRGRLDPNFDRLSYGVRFFYSMFKHLQILGT